MAAVKCLQILHCSTYFIFSGPLTETVWRFFESVYIVKISTFLKVLMFAVGEQKIENCSLIPESILHKSIAGRYRPVRVADGPITARCRFINNASWDVWAMPVTVCFQLLVSAVSLIHQAIIKHASVIRLW